MSDTQQIQTATLEAITREECAALFRAFITARPGLDLRDYGYSALPTEGRGLSWAEKVNTDRANRQSHKEATRFMRADARRIEADRRRALAALAVLEANPYHPALLAESLVLAFSGRLEVHSNGHDLPWLEYTAGQHTPTEYRAAAAAVLGRYAQHAQPKPEAEPAPALDSLFREYSGLSFDEQQKRTRKDRPAVPYYVTAHDSALDDSICVPAMNEAEANAVLAYMAARRELTRKQIVTAAPSRRFKLILDWRYHALDLRPPYST